MSVPKAIRLTAAYAALSILGVAGCGTMSRTSTRANTAKPTKVIDADQFIANWNENARKIKSLRCDHVDVDGNAQGQLISLNAKLAFEQSARMRLLGNSTVGQEIDLGSNDDEIWFWIRRAKPPTLYFCKKRDLPNVRLATPFQPEWILEALAVTELDASVHKPGVATPELFTLVSERRNPNGQPVTKRIVVDRATNRVSAFELFDGERNKLATVEIKEYHDDAANGVFVPRKIRVDWPEAETNLTLALRTKHIQLNNIDAEFSQRVFKRGDYTNSEVVDLAAMSAPQDPQKFKANRIRQTGPFENRGEIQPTRGVEFTGEIKSGN